MKNRNKAIRQDGYTLVELVITIVVLGLTTHFLGSMCIGLLAGSIQQIKQVEMSNLAVSQMEEVVKTGVNVTSQGWTSVTPYQWRRIVNTLRSSDGNPTLVEVTIEVKDTFGQKYSLLNHLGG